MKRRFSNHDSTCCCGACMAESGAEDAKAQDAHDKGAQDAGDSGKAEDSSAPRTYRHPAHAHPAGGDGGPGDTSKPKPIYSLEQIHTELTTNWEDHPGTPRKWMSKDVSYYIATDPTRTPDDRGDPDAAYVARGFNAEAAELMSLRRPYAALAFELWDDLIRIDLNETKDHRADITIAYTERLAGFTAADVSDDGRQIEAERIWITYGLPDHFRPADFTYVSRGYHDFVHEIGHALGLSHPGPYNVTASYGEDAVYAQDTRMFTVMSYFGAWREGATADGERTWSFSLDGVDLYPSTPMLHDVYAIQRIYGADTLTRAGPTVYGFNATADHKVFHFRSDTTPILTIWDGGGDHDTLDVSGYGQDQVINLNPGTYSNIGALTNNVAIAFDCWIEDAVGGAGDDRIEGNMHDNRLTGGAGIDTIFGGGGEDTIDGGLDADAMYGGSHDDTYLVDHLGDFIVESPDGGYDTAEVSVSGYTLDYFVERGEVVNPGGTTFTLTGNNLVNVLVGSAARDRLFGGSENDTIEGHGDEDYIDGGAGADRMYGGSGNDTYVVDNPGDRIFEDLPGGKDTAIVSWNGYVLPGNVENGRVGTPTGLELFGNGLRNILTGGAGRDTLHGGGDNDEIDGGAQPDWLYGDGGNDTFWFRRGEAHGDVLGDFNGNGAAAGDQIRLVGYVGATLTQLDSTHLEIFASGGVHEIITLGAGATFHPSDWSSGVG
jgi:serralysin